MSARVRVGIIGAGSWAVSNHIPALLERDDVELISAVRKGATHLRLLQDRFGFEHVTEDYRDALDRELDAVIVASPARFHHEHAEAALRAGAHVLCEKPFTLQPEDAWHLDSLAKQLDRHLLVSFGWHYRPTGIAAKQLIEDHGVGDVQQVVVAMASGTRELLLDEGAYEGSAEDFQPEPETWTDPALSGGGYAPAQLSHAMGLALWLTSDRVERVFAFANHEGAEVDLHDAVAVRYESGAIGTISGASCPLHANAIDAPEEPWPRHQLQVRIYGTAGQLIVDLERDFLWLYREDGVDEKVDLPPHAGLYLCDGPPNTLVDLTKGSEAVNRSPAELGAKTVEVVTAIKRSATSGQPVDAMADSR